MKNEMNEKNMWKSITVIAVLLSVIAIAMTGAVSAKSVYLVADHHASPTPINAYYIGPGGCCDLAYQATYNVASHVLGASGCAMYEDPNGDGDFSDAQILVTYESSNIVEVFNAVDFSPVKTVTASGASDLAGIVVDQEKELVYTVDRFTQNLYVYDANTFSPVGTLPIVLGTLSGAVGLALDETHDWLFVTDFTPTVHYFETNTWTEVGTITTGNANAIGIAYDEDNELVYTGGAFYNDNLLCKYDMTTSTPSCVDLSLMVSGMGAMGLAVDSDSYCLYVTTGYSGDDLRVFDSTLTQLCVYPDTEGLILNPAGICIPRAEISYGISVYVDIKPGSCPNPLNKGSKGVLPVAVLGTEDFDVTTIDPATIELTLEGVEEGVSPLRWDYEAVAKPFEGELCDCHELNDTYIDLTLKFDTQELVEELGLCDFGDGEEIPLTIIGNLYDGREIKGEDCIRVLEKGKE